MCTSGRPRNSYPFVGSLWSGTIGMIVFVGALGGWAGQPRSLQAQGSIGQPRSSPV
jgi:hypothetical protein